MPFQYGCFISYAHDSGDLISTFLEDLTTGLRDHLTGLAGEAKYWLDEQRLAGGMAHPQAIATAMCESACWILVYHHRYRRSDWCKREYRAMRVLESQRMEALGKRLPRERRMIVPILLNGELGDLPVGLQEERIVENFTHFLVSQPRIHEHPKFEARVRNIADHVWQIWRVCEDKPDEPSDCEAFEVPQADPSDWGSERIKERPR